ncbi:MAG: hypothetical protein MJ175_02190, partial [Clostridia bacterium]|nr:hypothetical protein [Clostridia bacterium]
KLRRLRWFPVPSLAHRETPIFMKNPDFPQPCLENHRKTACPAPEMVLKQAVCLFFYRLWISTDEFSTGCV